MKRHTFEEKRDVMLSHVTWELVDGQYVLHACNVLATEEFKKEYISQEEYVIIFIRRPATMVVYDNAVCYGTQSLKLNDYTTT
jgi:hypothetical protein